ncbi:MAG: phosphatase PAP2 family protein [Candidatus Paceibacterota bacterium]|jgi:undecaprenyl-diphosphatase
MISSIIAIDVWFENLMLAARTPALLQTFDVITFFGNTTTVLGMALIVGAYLALSDKPLRAYLIGFIVTLLGALSCGYALKTLIARARPDGLIPSIIETTYSFPSGHAVAAMAFYGFIAFFLARHYREHTRKIVVVTALLILSIGFSRLYLGVHFPSDVIAGFALGGIWLFIGIWTVRTLQSRTDSPTT